MKNDPATIDGQPSRVLESTGVRVVVTELAGHLTARFAAGGRTIDPFFTAPWWNEPLPAQAPPLIRVLRGDFFCLPFGNERAHGRTANDPWTYEGTRADGRAREMSFSMDLGPGEGTVRKRIRVVDGEPIVYQEHLVAGLPGPRPLGHHPTLKLPDREGAGIVDMSPPRAGFTPPLPVEDPASGGYSALLPGCEIVDRTRVPAVSGATVDLTRYPTPRGSEDLACFVSDPERDFVFSAVSVPSEGWLYFQLKDPRVLAETLLWMSNGGRPYPPWNGRVVSVLGVEEVTSFFHYGSTASLGPNFFRDRGYPCAVAPGQGGRLRVGLVMGLVPIGGGFRGVEDIVRKSDAGITIVGRGGERIDVPCRVGWLAR